jgi:hypothetical protein
MAIWHLYPAPRWRRRRVAHVGLPLARRGPLSAPQLSGVVDDIVAAHRQLVGPRHLGEPIDGVGAVVRARHTDRQSTLLVRTDGPVRDPSWTAHELTLEDLILAYLADGGAQAQGISRRHWAMVSSACSVVR